MEGQFRANDEFKDLAAVPDFFWLQPAFRALPPLRAEIVIGETVAAQSKLESIQTAR